MRPSTALGHRGHRSSCVTQGTCLGGNISSHQRGQGGVTKRLLRRGKAQVSRGSSQLPPHRSWVKEQTRGHSRDRVGMTGVPQWASQKKTKPLHPINLHPSPPPPRPTFSHTDASGFPQLQHSKFLFQSRLQQRIDVAQYTSDTFTPPTHTFGPVPSPRELPPVSYAWSLGHHNKQDIPLS